MSEDFSKVKKKIKQSDGSYKLVSQWTDASTVQIDNNTTLDEFVENTIDMEVLQNYYDMEILGYTTPHDFTTKNEIDEDGVYHQNVWRVCIDDLDVTYNPSHFKIDMNNMGVWMDSQGYPVQPFYFEGYEQLSYNDFNNNPKDKSLVALNNQIWIRDSEITSKEQFKEEYKGKYIYYKCKSDPSTYADNSVNIKESFPLLQNYLDYKVYLLNASGLYKHYNKTGNGFAINITSGRLCGVQIDYEPTSRSYSYNFTPYAKVSELSDYLPLTGGTLSGETKAPTPVKSSNDTTVATTEFVKDNLDDYLPLTGGTLSGTLHNSASYTTDIPNVEIGVTPTSNVYSGFYVNDKNGSNIGGVNGCYNTNESKIASLYVTKSDGTTESIYAYEDKNGNSGVYLGTSPNKSETGSKVVTAKFVKDNLADYLPLSGGSLSGGITANGNIVSAKQYSSNPSISIKDTVSNWVLWLLCSANGTAMGLRTNGYCATAGTLTKFKDSSGKDLDGAWLLYVNNTGQMSTSLTFNSHDIKPAVKNTYSLGSSALNYNDIYSKAIKIMDGTNADHYVSLLVETVGTTTAVGSGIVRAGNKIASGTAGNAKGVIRVWSEKNGYTQLISAASQTGTYTVTLPSASGTLALTSSDIRLKENIKDTKVSGIDFINSIKLHEFNWKETGDKWNCGYIADELKELDEHCVLEGSGGEFDDGSINPLCIDDFYISAYQTKAIQELSKENEELKTRLSKLEEKIANI